MAQIVLDTQNGLTIPALTNAQMNAIASPNTGALVFNTDNQQVNVYTPSKSNWQIVLSQFNFPANLSTNGYQILPTGVTIQWGSATTSNSGVAYVSLPIAFPTAFLTVGITAIDVANNIIVQANPYSVSQLSIGAFNVANARVATTVAWMAIGY